MGVLNVQKCKKGLYLHLQNIDWIILNLHRCIFQFVSAHWASIASFHKYYYAFQTKFMTTFCCAIVCFTYFFITYTAFVVGYFLQTLRYGLQQRFIDRVNILASIKGFIFVTCIITLLAPANAHVGVLTKIILRITAVATL